MSFVSWLDEESERRRAFPVAARQVFLAHAGVTALPGYVAEAMRDHIAKSCENHQEFGQVLRDIQRARAECGALIGAGAAEIALLGPTSLGLSLFANGITWKPGDEILCYHADYPANVYPWMALEAQGVKLRFLEPEVPGKITPELVAGAITERTRLLALASCHFLTGWRIDVDAIGRVARERGVLFSLDAIQTLGAFPTKVEWVDFLSADAHKWLLGPLAIGIVYAARRNFDLCRPTLLGAWNVKSPEFVTQSEIEFVDSAQRYEPGVLNITGIYGMVAALRKFAEVGEDEVARRILAVSDRLRSGFAALGFESLSPGVNEPMRSGIVTVRHPEVASAELFAALETAQISASLRTDPKGGQWIRFSPHFYNTVAEIDSVLDVVRGAVRR